MFPQRTASPANAAPVLVYGAHELVPHDAETQARTDADSHTEYLTTVTEHGLLQAGDTMPGIDGVEAYGAYHVINVINAVDTETCEAFIANFETAAKEYLDYHVPVFTLVRGDADMVAKLNARGLSQLFVGIDDETATALGIKLLADKFINNNEGQTEFEDEEAIAEATEFWEKQALRRAMFVVDGRTGEIINAQQDDDQEEVPSIPLALRVIKGLRYAIVGRELEDEDES